MQGRILGIAEERGMIRWEYGAIDGAFSPWQGWRRGRRQRGQGQGDADPQSYGWWRHAPGKLHHASQRGWPRKRFTVIATDKGYDAKALRQIVRKRGIRAQLPKRVWKIKKNRGRWIKKVVPRCQAERTFAWFQKQYRRLVVRWERIATCFDAFLAIVTIHIWIHRLLTNGVSL